LKISPAGLAHISIAIILLVYALAYKNVLALSTSLAMILIFYNEYSSFIRSRNAVAYLAVKRSLEKEVCNELDEVAITLSIENKSGFPISRLTILDKLPRFIKFKQGRPAFMISVPPHSIVNISYGVEITASGSHDFTNTMLIISGALGYFYEELEVDTRETIVALPLSIGSAIKMKSLQRILGSYIEGKSTSGLYDLASIREYQAGDDIRKVLWKTYARTMKLMVREDYGEAFARALVMVDIKKFLWDLGPEPNTIAQVTLRLFRSLVELLAKYSSVDLALCVGPSPKVVANAEQDIIASLHRIISAVEAGNGCESSIDVFATVTAFLGKSPEQYDTVVLITNPLSLAIEAPENFEILLKTYGERLMVLIPYYEYDKIIPAEDVTEMVKALSYYTSYTRYGVNITEESFEVFKVRK